MKNDRENTPTPQEFREVAESMTMTQRIQFEAIINMVTGLLVNIHQTSEKKTNDTN